MSGLKFYIGSSNGRHFEAYVSSLNIDIKNQNVILVTECYEITGENGSRLISEVSSAYNRNLIANNSTLVHPQTGQYWDNIPLDEKPEGITPIGEWDFFWFVANNVDIRVVPFVQATLANNRFRLMPTGFILDAPEEEVPEE